MSNRYQIIKNCFYAILSFAPFLVNAQMNIGVSVKQPNCNGYTNGEATLTVSGGTAPYTYQWSNGAGGQTLYASPGAYKATVTDASGKTAVQDVTITEPALLVANVSAMNGNCADDQSMMASATGGTAPYTFTWTNTNTNATSSGAMLSSPTRGGYNVVVTDARGCMANKFTSVEGTFSVIMNTTNVYCTGRGDGSVEIKVSGGKAPYSYKWSNNATTSTISSLNGGTYTVSITDGNGCVKTMTSTIEEPTRVKSNAVITGNCTGKGKVVLSPSGGIPPYKAVWTHGPSDFTLDNLTPGAYYVCVMDANGCPADTPINISDTKMIGVVLTKEDASCNGVNNGKIEAAVTGGAIGPYTYNWSNNAPLTSQSISNLASGTYTLTLVDGAGCTETKSVTINNTSSLNLTTASTTSLCGGTTGTASAATVSGGTAPYTYKWNNNATTKDLTNLGAGNYTLTVSDAKGCQATQTVNVGTSGSNITALSTVTDGKCNTTMGAVKLTASGGTAPYTYKYSGGTNQTGNFSDLAAGDYTFTITDANGCSFTQTSNVKNTGAVTANFNIAPNTSLACNADNLMYKITNSSGGALTGATYSWKFSGGRTSTSSNPDIDFNTLTGDAELTITSAEGCTDVLKKSFDVDLIRETIQDEVSGCVSTSLKPTSASNTKFTHSYSWTPLSIVEAGANTLTPTFKPNVVGNTKAYVTITNSLGCTKRDSVSVNAAAKITLNPTDIKFSQECTSRKLTFNNTNTNASQYAWVFGDPANPTAGSAQVSPSYTYGQSGEVTVTLTSALACSEPLSLKVPITTPLTLAASDDKNVCNDTKQTLAASSNGTNTIEWSANRNFTTIAGTGATFDATPTTGKSVYYVRTKDANGCVATDSVVLSNNTINVAVNTTALDLCTGADKTISVTNQNPNDGLTVVWTPANVIKGSNTVLNPTVNVGTASTGTITGTFKNAAGCEATKTVSFNATTVTLTKSENKNVCDATKQVLTATSNNVANKIEWSLNRNFTPVASTASSFDATPAVGRNVYYLRSTNANGCVVTDSIVVSNNELKVSVTTPTLSLCVGAGKQATVNAPAGTTVVWTPAGVIEGSNTALNPTLKASAIGNGKITGEFTNAAGCKTTQEINYTATEVKAALTASEQLVYTNFDVTLNATPGGTGYTYKWTQLPTSTTAQVKTQPTEKTTYQVEITDANGCKSTATVTVDVITPQCAKPYVYVPTAFSPNNDGRNDLVKVHGEFLTSCEFVIYNRWGEKVFETKIFQNGESAGWNGEHGSKGVCPDVYGFYVRGVCKDGTTFFEKGNITVLK